MNFQTIKPIEEYQFYLDLAFRRAKEKGKAMRALKLKGGRLEKSRYIELVKIQIIADTISSRMESILKSFPDLDNIPEFYNKLLKLSLDYGQLKKSLGAINWLRNQCYSFFRIYKSKLMKNKQFERINKLKREFLGRISSMVKQVKKDFEYLEYSRRVMKKFPEIKTSLKTVAIIGFPNVGKTTVLYHLSGSHAEINSYPFTTKGINVAYIGKGKQRIQLLDTPGTLNRFNKMNNIEKVAYLAIESCADLLVYVFDPLEEYPMQKQVKLYNKMKDDFDKECLIYLSKTDITDKKEIEEFKEKYPKIITDKESLNNKLLEKLS